MMVRRFITWVASASLLSVGIFLLGVAALVSSIGYSLTAYRQAESSAAVLQEVADLQSELYCRYVAGAPVTALQAQYFRVLGAGLIAVANEDDEALAIEAARGARVLEELDRAVEARDRAVLGCIPDESGETQ